jgi:hypothetical protein
MEAVDPFPEHLKPLYGHLVPMGGYLVQVCDLGSLCGYLIQLCGLSGLGSLCGYLVQPRGDLEQFAIDFAGLCLARRLHQP